MNHCIQRQNLVNTVLTYLIEGHTEEEQYHIDDFVHDNSTLKADKEEHAPTDVNPVLDEHSHHQLPQDFHNILFILIILFLLLHLLLLLFLFFCHFSLLQLLFCKHRVTFGLCLVLGLLVRIEMGRKQNLCTQHRNLKHSIHKGLHFCIIHASRAGESILT